jgi:hypothetical protein
MKPPILERIREEDITDAPDWFKKKVLVTLNRFMETVVQVLTKNVNFDDNFDSQTYTDTINSAALTSGYKFKVSIKGKPKGLQILKIVKTTENWTNFSVAPFPLWEYVDNEGNREIIIHNILGRNHNT